MPGWGLTGDVQLSDTGPRLKAPQQKVPPTNVVILQGSKDLAQRAGSNRPSNAPSQHAPSDRQVQGGVAAPGDIGQAVEGELPAGAGEAIQPLPAWAVRRLPQAQ